MMVARVKLERLHIALHYCAVPFLLLAGDTWRELVQVHQDLVLKRTTYKNKVVRGYAWHLARSRGSKKWRLAFS